MKQGLNALVTLSMLIGFFTGADSQNDITLTVQSGPVKVELGKTVNLWCHLRNEGKNIEMPVHWQSPPKFKTRSGDCTSFDNEKYNITCSKASTTFRFFNLTVKDVKLEDEGKYRCLYTRHNGIVDLQVFVPIADLSLTIDFKKKASDPQVDKSGFEAGLICETSCAYPAPTISWFEYGQPFEGEATDTITETGCKGKQKRTLSKVKVYGTDADNGRKEHNVSCMAENVITEQTLYRTRDINNGWSHPAADDVTTSPSQPVIAVMASGSIVASAVIPVLVVAIIAIVVAFLVRRKKEKRLKYRMRNEYKRAEAIRFLGGNEWTQATSPCTFALEKPASESPHRHSDRVIQPKILPNVLAKIGETPLVKINNITKKEKLECEILVKCEFFNVTGYLKDRIALRMVEDAEYSGHIKPGYCLIGQNSRNRGDCLALVAAVKGYRCTIVMAENVSKEKENLMRSLGADVVRIPTDVDEQEAAYRLQKVEPNSSYVMDPYRNPANALAHYDGTAEEIIDACEGKLDMLVTTVGLTGGLISGIARKIKQKCPSCKIVGVEPEGPIVFEPDEYDTKNVIGRQVQDVRSNITAADSKYIDKWYKSRGNGFFMARRLIKEEGLLCGERSGAAMDVAVSAAKDYRLKANQRVVVILPDSIRNYTSTALSDTWMVKRGWIKNDDIEKEWWGNYKVQSLDHKPTLAVRESVSIEDTFNTLRDKGFKQCPVVDDHCAVLGMATVGHMAGLFSKDKLNNQNPISSAIVGHFKKVDESLTLYELSQLLDSNHFVLVELDQKRVTKGGKVPEEMSYDIVTRLDLYEFIITHRQNEASSGNK